MDFDLLKSIREQLDPGPIIEWHRDGDPVDYPRLGEALDLFSDFISCVVTHGERLFEKADEVIGRCTTVCVSVIKGDPDAEIQYESVSKFLERKGLKPPMVIIKYVGAPPPNNPYEKFGLRTISRRLHTPDGNYKYVRVPPPMPESAICLDFLGRPAIDWRGRLFQCVKLDVNDEGLLGDLNLDSLESLWNSYRRKTWLEAHKIGRRDLAAPLCRTCVFYGVPSEA